jgi:prolipoprotein diacylglyceryltransferase
VLGAIMGVIVYGRGRMRPTWELLDELALPGLIVTVTAWIGCWLDGVAYGIQVPQNWGWLMDSDPFIDQIARWPTQMVGALLTLLAFLALLRISPGLARGATAGLMLFAIALTLLLVGLFRADPSMLLFQLRLDILGPAALTLVGIMITIHHSIRGRRSRS